MTANEYEKLVRNFDRDQIQARINRIPWNVNRAGKHYKKLVNQIIKDYESIRKKTIVTKSDQA